MDANQNLPDQKRVHNNLNTHQIAHHYASTELVY